MVVLRAIGGGGCGCGFLGLTLVVLELGLKSKEKKRNARVTTIFFYVVSMGGSIFLAKSEVKN